MTDQEQFEEIVSKVIQRDGIQDLMQWLRKTDFYTAPASTRYHGSFEGGLVKHSIAVYHRFRDLIASYVFGKGLNAISEESIAIMALFHDLCKVGTYKTEMRWRKNDLQQWEQYPTYKKEEDFAFGGHGSKSVYLVCNFMKLSPEEASAINAHMGMYDQSTYNQPSTVYEQNIWAWMLHVADEAATFIDKT